MDPAPYVPFRTFLSALETLERGCPGQIDRSLFPSYSGAIQGQLLGAFRFLKLMDEAQAPTAELREVLARPEHRKAVLRRLMEQGYGPLDLQHTSPKQLDEAMRRYGYGGATHKKALSFLLQAAQYAGIPLSALLRARTRGGGKTKRHTAPEPAAAAVSRTLELKSGGTLTLTASVDLFALAAEDREFLFEMVDRMQRYGGGGI